MSVKEAVHLIGLSVVFNNLVTCSKPVDLYILWFHVKLIALS